jgi:hypothetical protein
MPPAASAATWPASHTMPLCTAISDIRAPTSKRWTMLGSLRGVQFAGTVPRTAHASPAYERGPSGSPST